MVIDERFLRRHAVHHRSPASANFALFFFLGVIPLIVIVITVAWCIKTKGEDWYESEEVMNGYDKHPRFGDDRSRTNSPIDVTEFAITIPPVLLLETARRNPSLLDD